MNLKENINRIKQVMGIVKETIDIPSDSYVTMNIKHFQKYKKEIADLLQDKLKLSNGDFVTFKNSVISGYNQNETPILSNELQVDNRYLNYMISMGKQQFHSLLYGIFSDYYGIKTEKDLDQSKTVDCDPSNFKIVGPLTAKDSKSLMSYWIGQEGGQVYFIKLPKECTSQMTSDERRTYVTVEPEENRIHFPKGVPERLRGKKLGTLIYLKMIKKIGYITSSMANSAEIKMVYQDILSNPKYEKNVMSLLIQRQVIIFDRETNLDIKKIFNKFVLGKFTDKKSVRISPTLKEILGDDFTNWYESLEEQPEQSIENKIKKYEGSELKNGDTVVETTTGKIYSVNGEWEYKGKKQISLTSDKFETLVIPSEEKSRFNIKHRR